MIGLLLQKCIDLFTEMKIQYDNSKAIEKYGHFPSSAIIKYGKDKKVWLFENGSVEEVNELSISVLCTPVSGMFYPQAEFRFNFELNKSKAFLSYQFGPRYGRGFSYNIDWNKGEPNLTSTKTEWTS